MSSKRWVDGLFRERLEHRKFPVEDGEYEAVRALLEQRNAPPAEVVGNRVSTWWLIVAVPVAVMLWWSTAETTNDRADKEEPTTVEVAGFGSPTAVVSPLSAERLDPSDAMVVSAVEPEGADQASVGAGSTGPVMNFGIPAGSFLADRSSPSDGSRTTRAVNATSDVVLGDDDHGRSFIDAASVQPLLLDASLLGTISLLRTRSSLMTESTLGIPVQRELGSTKRRASGELHVFAAPLALRTRGGAEVDGITQIGSLYGFEYRVLARYFSVATGIHYGTYAMQAGRGAADVKLNFVEVPLLAGVEVGFKRFGVLVQGGMSLDFLFDSGGRYPTDDARTSAGFPDDAFNTLNYSWMLRPQASYRLNERLSLSAGPLWKVQLGSVAQNGLLKDARASGAGISAGLTWRLDRSTF